MRPLALAVLALALAGCSSMSGLFSSGSRSVIFLDSKGEVVRDKAGAPVVGTLTWDAKNVYPENLKTIHGAVAGPEGAKTDAAEVHPPPPQTALSLILALACALGASLAVYFKAPAFAVPLAGAGIFIAGVPYFMPAIAESPLTPILAVAGAVFLMGFLVWKQVAANKAAAAGAEENEKARDQVALATIGKAIAEGNLDGAVQAVRDYDPDVNAAAIYSRTMGVKPAPVPAPTPELSP
jgi:hypothetical protein